MASPRRAGGPEGQDPDVFEWKIPNVGRSSIINRSIGSPCTINLMLTFPSPASLDLDRIKKNVTIAQQLWPLLSITVVDQRTPFPRMRYRRGHVWDPDQLVFEDTYDPVDVKTDRDWCYDKALRLASTKVSFDDDPVWRITIFRAKTNPEKHRVYFAWNPDHLIIDGRGSIRLVSALVGKNDISKLPREDIELYEKAGLAQDLDEMPPYMFIAKAMFQGTLYPRLPGFVQRYLGQYPIWPQKVEQAPIDSPWKSSILDIPNDVLRELKVVAKKKGVLTMNAMLHTAWIVSLWAIFLAGDKTQTQAVKDCSVKDIRDDGDPYCVGGHATAYLWTSGIMTTRTSFWSLAKSYEAVSMSEQAYKDGSNMMRMLNLLKDGQLNPDDSTHRSPPREEVPVGDKRAHTMREGESLKRINSLSPYGGMSGIWSNMSYVDLPGDAINWAIGCNGAATATAFNTVLIGHKYGTTVQNSFSDGAAMGEEDVKKAEVMYLLILRRMAAGGGREWLLRDFISPRDLLRAKL